MEHTPLSAADERLLGFSLTTHLIPSRDTTINRLHFFMKNLGCLGFDHAMC